MKDNPFATSPNEIVPPLKKYHEPVDWWENTKLTFHLITAFMLLMFMLIGCCGGFVYILERFGLLP